ncbi:MAG TPA: hypothetical protein VKJ01_20655 [Candidatus Solibacter sp.]|nr:hypothetical protein [Candidatus Solibacter sp.]
MGILALVFLSGHPAVAQWVAVGVKGGVRTTDDTSGSLASESKRYIVGPMAEIRLPLRLSFEVDALYRRFGFTGGASSVFGSSITRERANSWEFPMIVKYRLPVVPAHPFVGAGYAPRTIHGTDVSSGRFLSGISQNPPASIYTYFFNQRSDTSYSLTHGIVVLGGVNLGAGHVRFSPELRYVHWNAPFLNEFGGDGSFQFVSRQDEFQVLLGVSWH